MLDGNPSILSSLRLYLVLGKLRGKENIGKEKCKKYL